MWQKWEELMDIEWKWKSILRRVDEKVYYFCKGRKESEVYGLNLSVCVWWKFWHKEPIKLLMWII